MSVHVRMEEKKSRQQSPQVLPWLRWGLQWRGLLNRLKSTLERWESIRDGDAISSLEGDAVGTGNGFLYNFGTYSEHLTPVAVLLHFRTHGLARTLLRPFTVLMTNRRPISDSKRKYECFIVQGILHSDTLHSFNCTTRFILPFSAIHSSPSLSLIWRVD